MLMDFFTIYTEKHTSSQFGKNASEQNPGLVNSILGRKFLFETFQPGNQGYLSRCHALTVYIIIFSKYSRNEICLDVVWNKSFWVVGTMSFHLLYYSIKCHGIH